MNTFTELVQNGFEVERVLAEDGTKPAVRISYLEPFYYVRTWEGMTSDDVYANIRQAEQDPMGFSVDALVDVQPDGEGVIDIDIATKQMHDEFMADYDASRTEIIPDDEPVTVAVKEHTERNLEAPNDPWWRRALRALMFWKPEAPEPMSKREPS